MRNAWENQEPCSFFSCDAAAARGDGGDTKQRAAKGHAQAPHPAQNFFRGLHEIPVENAPPTIYEAQRALGFYEGLPLPAPLAVSPPEKLAQESAAKPTQRAKKRAVHPRRRAQKGKKQKRVEAAQDLVAIVEQQIKALERNLRRARALE